MWFFPVNAYTCWSRWVHTAFSKLKGCAPKLPLVVCLNAAGIRSLMGWDAVGEPSLPGMCCCSCPLSCMAASLEQGLSRYWCAELKCISRSWIFRFLLLNPISFPRNRPKPYPRIPVLALRTGCTVLTGTYCPSSDKITISELKIILLTSLVRFPPFLLSLYVLVHLPTASFW